MEVGLVGKPSAGKSTFFKAATMMDVKISEVPFTTIKSNVGSGFVTAECVCKKYDVKCKPKNGKCVDGVRHIPVKLIDVGGLIPGSHLGKGLGNKFLDDLRQAACMVHVVDVSGTTDAEGKAATGYDPTNDIRFLEEEIDLWFTEIVNRALEKFKRKSRVSKINLSQILAEQLAGLQVTKEQVNEILNKIGIEDSKKFAVEIRKLSKPIVVAANKIDLPDSEENLKKLKESFSHLTIVPTCAASEIALRTADEKGLIEYKNNQFTIKDESKMDKRQLNGLNFIKINVLGKYGSTGVQECLNKSVFDFLKFIVVYPVADINKLTNKKGNVLPDAYLVKNGTTLKQFAFMIHSDIGEKFIGGLEAEKKRKLGADYVLKNNDVIEILFRK